MKYLAILKDSFRETLDCRTLWVLLVISTVLILLCWSLSFTPVSPEEALSDLPMGFNMLMQPRAMGFYEKIYKDLAFSVREPRALEGGEYAFRLEVAPSASFHRLLRNWDALIRGKVKKEEDPVPDADVPADFELQEKYLRRRLQEQQLMRVRIEAEETDGNRMSYRVTVKPSRPELLRGGHRVGILFGVAGFRLPVSAAVIVMTLEALLAQWIAGFAGILLAIVVTASFVPDMLQKGRLDMALAKPIRRPTLMIYKYLGGLLYVLLNAAYLIGGCWLALAARSRHWDASFLWSIPILTLFFAVLYSFSAWLGVLTRSSIVSILGTVGVWFSSSAVGTLHRLLHSPMAPQGLPGWLRKGVDIVYTVVPKTSDLDAINQQLIAKGNIGAEELAALGPVGAAAPVDWALILISSAGFLIVFLSLSCVSFSRRDY